MSFVSPSKTLPVFPLRFALLLLLLALGACSHAAPYSTTIGVLKPGSTMTVNVAQATVNAYQPISGQPNNRFTIAPTALSKGTPPPAPWMRPSGSGVIVNAAEPLANLLLRVPTGVDLVVDSKRGDINVTDIDGNAKVATKAGNVTVMLPGYAQASVGQGNISVTMGSTDWPGTLYFKAERGDINVSISEKAAFRVHLHTDNGTLFSDFDLRGTSQGGSETIDGAVNGGGPRTIDVETSAGAIRLLRLHPQA